jgi:uncharacterized membrane protein YkoI
MTIARWLPLALAGLIAPALAHAQEKSKELEAKLPAAVKKTFRAEFPKGEIEKVDAEEEGGVTVYDIEFRDGTTEKETDIAADGTMLEYTVVIEAKDIPDAAMAPIRKAAEGAAMKRIERIELSHETKDGKVVKLPRAVTHYAVELSKGGKTAEIVVAADGKVLEPARFDGEKDEAKPAGKAAK